MLFANDIVSVDEIKIWVNHKLKLWKSALEPMAFRLEMTQSEYMKCNCSKIKNRNKDGVKIMDKSDHVHHYGLIIRKKGKIKRMLSIGLKQAG